MKKISNTGKIIAAAVAAAGIVVLVFIFGMRPPTPTQTTNSTPSNGTAATTEQDQNQNTVVSATLATTPTVNPVVPPSVAIHWITPVKNEQWKIGGSNPISWDKEGNFTGEIDLLDAKTNKFLGVILSETGPHQTSYTWDTRSYSLSRYSPLRKELVPGTYAIRLKFDGNNLPTLISPAVTISL